MMGGGIIIPRKVMKIENSEDNIQFEAMSREDKSPSVFWSLAIFLFWGIFGGIFRKDFSPLVFDFILIDLEAKLAEDVLVEGSRPIRIIFCPQVFPQRRKGKVFSKMNSEGSQEWNAISYRRLRRRTQNFGEI